MSTLLKLIVAIGLVLFGASIMARGPVLANLHADAFIVGYYFGYYGAALLTVLVGLAFFVSAIK